MKCVDCGEEGHKAGWPFCPGRKLADSVVVNKDAVVVNRRGDRHRKSEKRRVWQMEYMRKRRGTPGGANFFQIGG